MEFKDFVDTSPSVKLERGKEYPFIPMDVVDGQRKFPVEIKHKNFSGGGAKFANGDTIFARITPCLENGKIVKIQGLEEGVGFGSTEFFVFRGKDGISDSDFVYYLSRTDTIRDPAVKSMVGASGRQRANKTVVDSVQVTAPDLSQQKQIASVLSTYDNLIENNTRRIQILEQMAQAIYREAFATTNGKKIPLSDVITIYRGKSYAGDELSDTEGLPFVNLKCIDRDGGFRKSGLKRFTGKYKDTQKVIAGDIVMAVTDMTQDRRIIARAARIPTLDGGFGIISMDLVKIEPKDGNDKDYIYLLLRWSDFSDEVKNHANGANVLHLIPDRITDFKTHIASVDQQMEFGKKVRSLLDLIDKLELQNESLRQTRDLLTPKLVTGEIAVK